MKKLLVLALMTLSVAVFAADENTSSDSTTGTTTTSVGGAAGPAPPEWAGPRTGGTARSVPQYRWHRR